MFQPLQIFAQPIVLYALFVTCGLAGADSFYTPARDKYTIDKLDAQTAETLPKVLLIGDSIMSGYFKQTKQQLEGVAQVFRHPGNAGETRNGLKKIDQWLGDTKWDVIHFNWGLHDLCYRHPDSKVYGNRDKIRGTLSVPLEEYEKNLKALVKRLKETGAKLIFATTTKIPENEAGRFVGDEVKYNTAALDIMKQHDIAVNDLYELSSNFNLKMYVAPADVHHTGKANRQLAEQVAKAVREQLR
jgi:lysophospholipase L1-like esterase